jgi:hypothetical protein
MSGCHRGTGAPNTPRWVAACSQPGMLHALLQPANSCDSHQRTQSATPHPCGALAVSPACQQSVQGRDGHTANGERATRAHLLVADASADAPHLQQPLPQIDHAAGTGLGVRGRVACSCAC